MLVQSLLAVKVALTLIAHGQLRVRHAEQVLRIIVTVRLSFTTRRNRNE